MHFEIALRDLPVRDRLLRISVPDEIPMTHAARVTVADISEHPIDRRLL